MAQKEPRSTTAGIDFFDVDHTLTRRSSGSRYVALAMRRGVLPRRLLFAIAWFSLTYSLGIIRFSAREEAVPYLRGLRRGTLVDIARESFERWLRADVFPGAMDLVRRLHDDGRRVMLATSSIDFIVAPLAEYLGIDGVLATTLEFKDDVCTGRIIGAPMFRGEKRNAVLSYLAENGTSPTVCSFYSDSAYDLPLLESVGKPVAVNPDARLRRIARARGWAIIDLA
jgi:HAD superfamily hydrolase (TIGR01490 family)